MNRKTSLTALYIPEINPDDWKDEVKTYGIEGVVQGCPQLDNKPVIFCERYDETLIKKALNHKPPLTFIANLRMWFDDGKAEILINEKNYTEYDFNEFYKVRTRKYDIKINPLN